MGFLTVDKRIFDKLVEVLEEVRNSDGSPESRQRLDKLLKLMPQAMGGSAKEFSAQIRKLVDAGNADRAIKLTEAAKHTRTLQPWVPKAALLLFILAMVGFGAWMSMR